MSHWSSDHAVTYDEKWGELTFHQQIPTLAGVSANNNIVEIGCGGGFLSLCLARHAKGVSVLGLDPTPKMIELAEKRRQLANLPENQLKYLQAGAEQLNVNTESIDIVIAAFSIHHWSDPNSAMSLIFNGLKQKGKIWLCEDLNAPTEGVLEVNKSLKAYKGVKQLLEKTGFVGIEKQIKTSSEGEFLIVEAIKPGL